MSIPVGNPGPGGHHAAGQRTREACLDRAHRGHAAATILSPATHECLGAARVAERPHQLSETAIQGRVHDTIPD